MGYKKDNFAIFAYEFELSHCCSTVNLFAKFIIIGIP